MTIEYRCSKCSSLLPNAFSQVCQSCDKDIVLEKTESKENLHILDPDKPAWGFGASFVFWAFSVFLIFFSQVPALISWMSWLKISGQEVPTNLSLEKHPELAVFSIFSTFFFQIITVAISYRFITRTSKGEFFRAIGWYWPEKLGLLRTLSLTALTFILFAIIASLLPNKENQMQQLIESSMAARISIGFVAVVGAPFVEELIYRGVLFSGFCKDFGREAAIIVVSLLFLAVHIPQYWGAWGGIAGLGFLSLMLTVVRAYSGAILPAYVMHLTFNSVQVSLIIAQGLGLIPKDS